MKLRLKPALEYSIPALAKLLNESFAGYLVKINFNPTALAHIIQQDGVDLSASQIVLHNGQAAGCALIARRGWTSRVAAIGLVPASRGQGIGRWFMKQLIAEAQERREQIMMLEVIEQNEPAVHLYKGLGFEQLDRLVGYHLDKPQKMDQAALQEVDVREVARLLAAYGSPGLPWQISGESLAQSGWPNRGYRLDSAYAAISDPDQPQIVLKGLVVPEDKQRQGLATRMVQALISHRCDRIWRVPIVWPEKLAAGLFEPLGFSRESLSQLQLRLDLT